MLVDDATSPPLVEYSIALVDEIDTIVHQGRPRLHRAIASLYGAIDDAVSIGAGRVVGVDLDGLEAEAWVLRAFGRHYADMAERVDVAVLRDAIADWPNVRHVPREALDDGAPHRARGTTRVKAFVELLKTAGIAATETLVRRVLSDEGIRVTCVKRRP